MSNKPPGVLFGLSVTLDHPVHKRNKRYQISDNEALKCSFVHALLLHLVGVAMVEI
jgi:hypothetical protein